MRDGGRDGAVKKFVPIGSQAADSTADPHAIAVWRGFGPGSPYELWVVDQSDAAAPAPAPPATGSGQANGSGITVAAALALGALVAAGLLARRASSRR